MSRENWFHLRRLSTIRPSSSQRDKMAKHIWELRRFPLWRIQYWCLYRKPVQQLYSDATERKINYFFSVQKCSVDVEHSSSLLKSLNGGLWFIVDIDNTSDWFKTFTNLNRRWHLPTRSQLTCSNIDITWNDRSDVILGETGVGLCVYFLTIIFCTEWRED